MGPKTKPSFFSYSYSKNVYLSLTSSGLLCLVMIFHFFPYLLNFSFIEDVSNASQVAGSGKEPTRQCRRRKKCVLDPWVRKIPLEEEMAAHHSIRGWEVPWTEEPGGLQSRGSQRVGHD